MSVFKCKMCGGTIEFAPGDTVGICDSCGTKQTLPRLDDDRKANLYDRANHFRRNNDYDKAMGIYEQILNEDNTDAEAYWSLVLCRYGIEYVEDPTTHKRVPTVNRTQYTSIFADEDYKSALQYADGSQKEIYQQEAAAIDKIQKDILEISQKEKPFDVFICYKETDNSGRRTPDSVLANDLYHQLTQEGFKVFFSRITLEDKLGSAYEPYIFAALNSAKVMVVLGTKPEYLNAVWVKNEWSRYLALIKAGAKKVLIPAYRDMDPYDLPEEFSHLQAQDMSKLGFMQDLIRGIQKLTQTEAPKAVETVVAGSANTAALLRRVFLFLEDGNWREADEYCEKVLDQEPECGEAYLGKLMAEFQIRSREQMPDCPKSFEGSSNYQKILRFGSSALVEEVRRALDYVQSRNEQQRKQRLYDQAVSSMTEADTERAYQHSAELFRNISGFRDAEELEKSCLSKAEECREEAIRTQKQEEERQRETLYNRAVASMEKAKTESDYLEAVEMFRPVLNFRDGQKLAESCRASAENCRKDSILNAAKEKLSSSDRKDIQEAISLAQSIREWKDADKVAAAGEKKLSEMRAAEEKKQRTIAIVAVILVAALCAFGGISVLRRNADYKAASELYAQGQYEQALAAFRKLGTYKDSAAMCESVAKAAAYDKALAMMDEGDFTEAENAFSQLGDYLDSAEQANRAKYAYVNAHKNRDDALIYDYLKSLKEAAYQDSEQLFNTLYAWSATVVINTDPSDETTNITSIEASKKETVLYIHVKLDGGEPEARTRLVVSVTWPDGASGSNQSQNRIGAGDTDIFNVTNEERYMVGTYTFQVRTEDGTVLANLSVRSR